MSSLKVHRLAGLKGSITAPPDKSMTHRAYLFASLAQGDGHSVIRNPLDSEDCLATKTCLEQLGSVYENTTNGVRCRAARELHGKDLTLACGNSGTTMRLLTGVLAGLGSVSATLTGDASLSRRPMGRITKPLSQMGASIVGETAPLKITGQPLKGIDYISPVASAQVKSCLILAGCRAEGETWVTEPSLSRDHTETMLTSFGAELLSGSGHKVGIKGGTTWGTFEFEVPGDISSAAFFLVAGTLIPGSSVRVKNVGVNPTRTGILDVLRQVGSTFELLNFHRTGGEPVADIHLEYEPELAPFAIAGELVPRLIDEVPVLAVLATQINGMSTIMDAAELKVKESNRIDVMAENLRKMGANIEATDDGMIITGPTPLIGANVEAYGDHRIAMAMAVAGAIAEGETIISGAESISTSYPHFMEDMNQLSRF